MVSNMPFTANVTKSGRWFNFPAEDKQSTDFKRFSRQQKLNDSHSSTVNDKTGLKDCDRSINCDWWKRWLCCWFTFTSQEMNCSAEDFIHKPLCLWRQFPPSSNHSRPSGVSTRSSGAAASHVSSFYSRSHCCTSLSLHPDSAGLQDSCGSKGKHTMTKLIKLP